MKEKTGFAGMGIMGVPMAMNLLKAGYPLMVYNRTSGKTRSLTDAGAAEARSRRELAEWADVAVLMLTGPDAVEDFLFAEKEGLLAGARAPGTIINMSTVPPSYTRSLCEKLAALGISFIDAPVSGSRKPAEEASLIILAGGDKYLVERFTPFLSALGKKVVYCGAAGQGSEMKVAVNLLLAVMTEGLCEAANLAERNGLSLAAFLDVVASGPLSCPLFNAKSSMLLSGDYSPQFPLKHVVKDLRFALGSADARGAAIPAGHTVFQLYRQGMGRGLGDLDFSAVKKIIETLSAV